MKRSQTAKISKKKKQDSVESSGKAFFINDEDRNKFVVLLEKSLRKKDFRKKINEKTLKGRSFKMTMNIPELKELGIDPDVILDFKKVRGKDMFDMDFYFQRLKNINLSEYFDVVYEAE